MRTDIWDMKRKRNYPVIAAILLGLVMLLFGTRLSAPVNSHAEYQPETEMETRSMTRLN